jgi:hypothetical protein
VRAKNRSRLSVQSLESREVPACVVAHPTASLVLITGDAADDSVVIRDDGAGHVFGFATGAGGFSFTGIKTIRVDTHDGNDSVRYDLIGNLQPGQQRFVTVYLGAGNDSLSANLEDPVLGVGSDLLKKSHMTITAVGGLGKDSMHVDARKDVDVAVGASLVAALFGDDGSDIITGLYHGENDGSVSFQSLDGGAGSDFIRGIYQADPGSTGSGSGVVRGQDGNDKLALMMFGPNVSPLSVLDGGNGFDTGIHTANVTMINVP